MKTAGRERGRLRSVRGVRGMRAGEPRSAAAAAAAPIPLLRHQAFRERLREIDGIVERTLAEAGGAPAGEESRIADALEHALDAWAQLARTIESGAIADLVFGSRQEEPWTPEIDDFGYEPAYEQSVAPLFRALYRRWWRVEVAGLEHVPGTGRALLVANHAGGLFAYDGAMLKLAVQEQHPSRRALRPLVDDFVYNLPFVGTFMTRCGAVRACPENAERLLMRDEAVVVFPEGTKGIGKLYRDRYRLARFGRGGFVRIALRTRSPIVPVAVIGSEEIHPILARWDGLARLIGMPYFPLTPTFPWLGLLGLVPLPSKWRIEFGEPIDWRATYGPEAARDRLLVSRLREEVRDRVQRLVRTALERRGPAFI
jgi:1-acyl-sn-glycerol-3-phosphate acyltransferase